MNDSFCIPFESIRIDIETRTSLLSQQLRKSVFAFYEDWIPVKMKELPNKDVAWRISEEQGTCPIPLTTLQEEGQSLLMHGIPGRTDIHLVYGKILTTPPWTYILNGVTHNLIAINRDQKTISVYPMANERTASELTNLLMIDIHLILREICTRYLLDNGWGMMHGGAVELCGKGIAVWGKSRSGKTSFLTNLMLNKKAAYIANDRLLFSKKDSTFYLRGWPSSMRMGMGTLFQYEQLRSLIPARWRKKIERFTSEELWAVNEKISLHGNKILESFGVISVPKSTLDIVFLPRLSLESNRTVIRPASSEDRHSLLGPEIFLVPDLEHPDWLSLSVMPLQEAMAHAKKIAHELIAEIPIYIFESGGDPNEMNQALVHFLQNWKDTA